MKAFLRFARHHAVILILAWAGIAGLWLSATTSATTDEMIHVSSGYLALTRGDHRFDPEHPFLFKYLTAAPVLLLRPNLPPQDAELWDAGANTAYDAWQQSREWTDQWVYASGNDASAMVFLARLAGVASFVGLCWLVYYLGSIWFSERIGRWALFFTAFNPTLLAHGATANDDVALATAILLALWALWRYWERPNMRRALVAGLSIAVAITVKFSGIALLPIALAWVVYVAWKKKVPAREVALHFLGATAVLWLFIWVTYFFRSPINFTAPTPSGESFVITRIQTSLAEHGLTLEQGSEIARHILPASFLKGLFLTLGASTLGRATYILGQDYGIGQWFYFPVLYLLKTQLVALVLGVLGIYLAIRERRRWSPGTVLVMMAVIVIGTLSIRSKLNLGIRHITPLLAFASFGYASVAVWLVEQKRRLATGTIFLLYTIPVLAQSYNLLGFSNGFIRDKADSWKYFNDSNLDWGQQAKRIARYGESAQYRDGLYVRVMHINYFWNPYAVQYFEGLEEMPVEIQGFNPRGPLNGLYVVTATQLSWPEYERFRKTVPFEMIDTATFAYTFNDDETLLR